jgi:hypothetical protein
VYLLHDVLEFGVVTFGFRQYPFKLFALDDMRNFRHLERFGAAFDGTLGFPKLESLITESALSSALIPQTKGIRFFA